MLLRSLKILVVLSEYGYWGEELIGPLEALDKAGYETVFMTPTGKRAEALPPSMDHTYVDPPLGRPVVAKEMAGTVKAMEKSARLDNPLSLKSLMPERPYFSAVNYLKELEAALRRAQDRPVEAHKSSSSGACEDDRDVTTSPTGSLYAF